MPSLNFTVEVKEEFNKRWLKIFYHNSTGGVWFKNEEEINFIEEPQRYSILGLVNKKLNLGGYYEFLLQYPEIEGYNNWKQKTFLFTTEESGNSGYSCSPQQGLNCTWNEMSWKGLFKSTRNTTFIDGSNGFYWWYSIGSKTAFSSYDRFPGPAGGTASVNGTTVTEVYLWIRIPPSFYVKQTCNSFFKLKMYLCYLFVMTTS